MTDQEFEAACAELDRLATLVSEGTPEQIATFAEDGWWAAMDTLRKVYNDWLMSGADAI